jgi:hypothetical protein
VALSAGAGAERADALRNRNARARFLAATSSTVIRVGLTITGASVRLKSVAEAHP